VREYFFRPGNRNQKECVKILEIQEATANCNIKQLYHYILWKMEHLNYRNEFFDKKGSKERQ
jgi:hypothetical protein